MAEGQVKQVLEKEIICPLCLDIFKEPKKLPCDHVYCKECLKSLAEITANATISCPECRFLAQPLYNDVSNFPTAFRVNRLIQAYHQIQVKAPPIPAVRTKFKQPPRLPIKDVNCKHHTTQPLVFYCESCQKSLCPDCVTMTQEHANHKYGFFKEVAPKYRKNLLSEYANVKTQEIAISATLKEVMDAERSVVSHAGKCQSDIDRAFDDMFSALEECKQVMKDEANEHYRSLAVIFESKKQQLEKVQDELKEVSSSVIGSVQDDDQHFMEKVESIMTKIKNLLRKVETVPLKVTEPQLLTAQAVGTDIVVRYFKTLCSLHNLACPKMCKVEESISDLEMYVDRQDTFTLTLHDSADNPCNGGENDVEVDVVNLEGSSTKGMAEPISMNRVKLTIRPERRGQHKLSVIVNGAHIMNSPFTVFVNMPPKRLSQPVTSITGLKNPTGLIYSQGKVMATEKGRNRIVKIDAQCRLKELIQLIDVTELTQDSNLNLYATTTMYHKVHKLSKSGKVIKTVGHYGKKNAEFNFPNGLRVNRNNEVYICDSGNNRIQVFDLDLKYKRSFGKKGSGKGQFDFPSDVTFDSSGCIYIADNGNSRIQVFTPNERHILTITGQKESSIKFDPLRLLMYKNHIYVTDYFNHYIIVMSLTGETISKFGGDFLHEPEGITVDSNGFVYVTSHHSKIIVF